MSIQPPSGSFSAIHYYHYQQTTVANKFPPTSAVISTATCKLCGQIAVHPTHLSCKHIFCTLCLHTYVDRGGYMDCLDFPCPHCKKASAPPWGIWHLSHKVLDRPHDEIYQTWKYEAMCDNCATQALYATAGRHCNDCNINLCDTCSYAHSVAPHTHSHRVVTVVTKTGNR